MPRTVKLTSADARAWRENRAQWVSPKGFVLRAVTPEEEKAVFPALEQVKRFKQSGTCNVEAIYKTQNPESGAVTEQKVPMQVVVRTTRTGREEGSFLFDLFVNGNRYVKGREVLRSRILDKHGECILQGPNGKQICVLRDPRINRPTFGESQRQAPSPERCHCRGFKDNPDVGRHHIACEWNLKSPPHERALPIQRESIQRGLMDMVTPIEGMRFDAPALGGTPSMPITQTFRGPTGSPIVARGGSAWPQGGVAAMSGPVVVSGPGGGAIPVAMLPAVPPPPPGFEGQEDGDPSAYLPPKPSLYTAPLTAQGVTVAHTPRELAVRGGGATPLVSPEQCENDCRGLSSGTKGWAWPNGRKPEANQHHPLCKNAGPWRTHAAGQKSWMLYDIDRRIELREATPEERAKAEVELSRNGIRSVMVGERLYAVVEAGGAPSSFARNAPSMAGAFVRPTPSQEALQGNALVTSRPRSAKAPGELTLEELEQEIARRRAVMASQLPPLPDEALAVQITEEVTAEGGPPSWGDQAQTEEAPGELPAEPCEGAPYVEHDRRVHAEVQTMSVSGDVLRDARGLVGLQQKDASIERGPVSIIEPEPFVDPLESSVPEVVFSPAAQ